jgi:hypothetical protein
MSLAERGSLICVIASGIFMSPLTVYLRTRLKPELVNGTPPGTVAVCHPSGWIQTHVFTVWFEHVKMFKPKPDDPNVLNLDGYFSRTRSPESMRGYEKWECTLCVCYP